jgi:uncharacterized protein YqeY
VSVDLRSRLQQGLKVAMKSQDRVAIAGLRSALSAIANAEAVDVEHAPTSTGSAIAGAISGVGAGEALRRELSPEEVAAVVAAEIAERRSSADEYERLGQAEDAGRLRVEADVLRAYL